MVKVISKMNYLMNNKYQKISFIKMSDNDKPVLFWDNVKHPENYYLSNFYPYNTNEKLTLEFENVIWASTEHLYQARKFMPSKPEYEKKYYEWINHIRTQSTPLKAKYLGNQWTYIKYSWQQPLRNLVIKYKPYVQIIPEWEHGMFGSNGRRCHVMQSCLKEKFDQNIDLKNKLIKTYPRSIGEATGSYWGIHGENMMGILLMNLRSEYMQIPPQNLPTPIYVQFPQFPYFNDYVQHLL